MFSKACEYAIRAAVYIASESNGRSKIGIDAICTNIEAPKHFTAKILQTLTRRQIINSQKGVNGGFFIDSEQRTKPIKIIVEAIDGESVFIGCGLGLKECSETKPCAIHHQFKQIRNDLNKMMERTTIDMLAKKLVSGETVLVQ